MRRRRRASAGGGKPRPYLPWVALLLLPLSGCTLTTDWRGDPRFVTESANGGGHDWTVGETTMPDVVADMGPPDEILRQGTNLWFLYRFRYIKSRELRIVAYGAQWFRYFSGRRVDDVILVVFDPDDRLSHYGLGKYTADGDLVSSLLD